VNQKVDERREAILKEQEELDNFALKEQ